VALDTGDLISWHLLESFCDFIVSSSNNVHNKLVHHFLEVFENFVSLYLLNYCSKAVHMRRHLFFLVLCLSLIEDFFLLSPNALLFTDLLIDYLLLTATGMLFTAFDAPSSPSIIHVNFCLLTGSQQKQSSTRDCSGTAQQLRNAESRSLPLKSLGSGLRTCCTSAQWLCKF